MPYSRRSSAPQGNDLDTDVILAAIGGSAVAFDRLFEHYQKCVRYAAGRAALKMGYFDDIDELTQEVWCRFLRNERQLLAYFDPSRGPFWPFIRRLALQQAIQAIRRYRRQVPDLDLHGQENEYEDQRSSRFVAELIQSDLYDRLLERANAELGKDDRNLLREVHLGQRTCRALAKELSISEDAIYKRNERLLKKLHKMVCDLQSPKAHRPNPSLALALMLIAASIENQVNITFDSTSPATFPDA